MDERIPPSAEERRLARAKGGHARAARATDRRQLTAAATAASPVREQWHYDRVPGGDTMPEEARWAAARSAHQAYLADLRLRALAARRKKAEEKRRAEQEAAEAEAAALEAELADQDGAA